MLNELATRMFLDKERKLYSSLIKGNIFYFQLYFMIKKVLRCEKKALQFSFTEMAYFRSKAWLFQGLSCTGVELHEGSVARGFSYMRIQLHGDQLNAVELHSLVGKNWSSYLNSSIKSYCYGNGSFLNRNYAFLTEDTHLNQKM